jgi:hypothetical protein
MLLKAVPFLVTDQPSQWSWAVIRADIYYWKVLRRDVGLSRAEVEASLRELIGDIAARSA